MTEKKRKYEPRQNFPTSLGINRKVLADQNPELFEPGDKAFKFLPVFPLIVRDEHLTYGKTYDVFYTHYTEIPPFADKPLIRYEHSGFWQDVRYHGEMGESFTAENKQKVNNEIIDFGICARKGINFRTFQKYLDILEDCRLIKRIRCQMKNFPIFVQICTPYSPEELERNDYALWRELYARVENAYTANQRAKLGKKYPLLRWDVPTLMNQLRAERPQNYKNFQKLQEIIGEEITAIRDLGDDYLTPDGLFERVKLICRERKMFFSPKLYVTALGCLFVESDEDIDENHILAKL